jgi:hypothetical protein
MEKVLMESIVPACLTFGYPAYQSHLAWQKPDLKEKEMWMKYWCISGLAIVLIDNAGDAVAQESIGVYELFKIILFLCCMLPIPGVASAETRQWGAVMGIAEHLSFIWYGTLIESVKAGQASP